METLYIQICRYLCRRLKKDYETLQNELWSALHQRFPVNQWQWFTKKECANILKSTANCIHKWIINKITERFFLLSHILLTPFLSLLSSHSFSLTPISPFGFTNHFSKWCFNWIVALHSEKSGNANYLRVRIKSPF